MLMHHCILYHVQAVIPEADTSLGVHFVVPLHSQFSNVHAFSLA